VKAESDYCCTSGNAVDVVNAIPSSQEILFLPDFFLGAHVRRMTGRKNIRVWMGECHVHAGITPESLERQRAAHPGAELLIHPECGCSTNVVEAISAGDVASDGAHMLSTEGMMRRPAESPADSFIIATETGILHRLRLMHPSKSFVAASDEAECSFMKLTTLPKLLHSLETMTHRITVPEDIASRARVAIERMVSIGGASQGALELSATR
jgi:quinolinate synthase